MRRATLIGCLIWLLGLSGTAHATMQFDTWRAQAVQTRRLAENNLPQAYREVQRLQVRLRSDASLTDQALFWNLMSRVELGLAETEKAAQHAQQAMLLAKQQGDKVGQAEANLNLTLIAINQGNIEQAHKETVHALEVLQGVDRPDLVGEAMLRTAMMYRRVGQLNESVTLAMQQMEIARRVNTPLVLAYAYQGLAITYGQNGRVKEAREYSERELEQARAIPSKLLEADALLGMGNYDALGGDVRRNESLIRQALTIYRSVGGPFYLGRGLFTLGDFLRHQQRTAEALPLFNEAATIWERHNNKIGLWWTLRTRSEVQQALGNLHAAQSDADRSHVLAKDIGLSLYLGESLKRLSEVAAARADFQQAYRLSKDAADMASSASREYASAQVVELAKRFESDVKQREINQLTLRNQQQTVELQKRTLEQRWLWTLLGAGILILVGTAFFLLRLHHTNRMLETLNRQVQRSQNQLHATLAALPDLMLVMGLDGRYYEVFATRADLLVEPVEKLLGKTVFDVLPPEAASICIEALQEANAAGISVGKQYQLLLPQGKFWFELSVAKKTFEADGLPRFVVLSRNITERKQTEERLHLREQEFRAMVENSRDAIARYDSQCRRIYVNPALQELLGIEMEELVGKNPRENSVLNDARAYAGRIRHVLDSGLEDQMEGFFVDLHGSKHWGDIRFIPEFGVSGQVNSVLTVARDITERKRMELRLEETQLLLRLLAQRNETLREDERKHLKRELHDELGQSLLALRMGLSMLDIQFGSADALLRENARRMIGTLDSTIQVVRDVVTSIRPSSLDLGIVAALEWLVEEYQKFSESAIRYELHVCEGDIELDDARATTIFRIVQESLTNIVRHAQASQVDITLARIESHYLLEVRDNGRGFDTGTRKEKSFGLVSIRERALALGGDVEIDSAPNRSTAIKVKIPIHPIASNPLSAS